MEMNFKIAYVLLLGVAMGFGEVIQRSEPHLQHPRIFREVLKDLPRAMIGKVAENLWIAYDTETGRLMRVWTPQEDGLALFVQGITSDGNHGKSKTDGVYPEEQGKMLRELEKEEGHWKINGKKLRVELDETTWSEDEWAIVWRYDRGDGSFGRFEEKVSLKGEAGVLTRSLQGVDLGEDEFSPHPLHEHVKEPLVLKEALAVNDVKSSWVGYLKEGRSFGMGNAFPVHQDKKGGFYNEKLNNLHPGYDLMDLTPLFGDHATRIGGMDFLPNGDLLVALWEPRGGVYRVKNPGADSLEKMSWEPYTLGLHAPLGLLVHEGKVYVTEKHALIELIDEDGDGFSETHRNVCNRWGAGMNFHQFSYGPVAKDGKLFVTTSINVLAGGATGKPVEKDRGCLLAIDPETHDYEVWSAGLRTPNGLGHGPKGSLIVLDNQGDYKPGNPILVMKKGGFYHHISEPPHPLAKNEPTWPSMWLPQGILGNSLSDPVLLENGLFKDQVVFGDVRHGGLKRATFEEVNGEMQGAVVRYSGGIRGGTNRIRKTANGDYFVGVIGTAGNWGRDSSVGIVRLRPNEKEIFEIKDAKIRKEGFVVNLTQPLKEGYGWNPADYMVRSYWLEPTIAYGGPLIDVKQVLVKSATVSKDRLSVYLELGALEKHRIYELHFHEGTIDESGQGLWTGDVFYTVLNTVDQGQEVQAPPSGVVKLREEVQAMKHQNELWYSTLCVGCHTFDDNQVQGPSFKYLYPGSKRTVIRGGEEKQIKVDMNYVLKSIRSPHEEVVKGYQPIMPELRSAMGGQAEMSEFAQYLMDRAQEIHNKEQAEKKGE